MSTLSENVSVTITVDSVGIARAGFGVMLIPSYTATWLERTRTYEDIGDVSADFASGTPEYLSAGAAFAQSPRPEKVIIGRFANKPTQQYTIGQAQVVNSTAYAINVTAPGATPTNPVTYTSDASATAQEIHNGLVTALNAVTGKNYTATFSPLASLTPKVFTAANGTEIFTSAAHGLNTGDGPVWVSNSGGALPAGLVASTDYYVIKIDANTFYLATSLANALAGTNLLITTDGTGTQTLTPQASCVSPILPFLVTGSAAGNWFSLEVVNAALLSNKQTHADPGIAADLDAILLENDSWYALHTYANSKLMVLAAAAWIETQPRLYVVAVVDTDAINTAVGGATDTLAALNALTYNRTAGAYYPAPAAMFGAAWMGRVLPDIPGTETWKFKTLAGIAATNLNATHRTNLKARKANYYVSFGGVNKTTEGTLAGGTYTYIDVTRGLDSLKDDMQKSVFEAMSGPEKIPYTDQGIAVIRSEMKSALKRAAENGVITPDFVITVPKVSSISSGNKVLRKLPNMKWSATLQGAIHSVDIVGVVSF